MKPDEKYAQLIERLIAKTEEKSVDWELINGQVSCLLGDFYIFLTDSRDAEGEPFEFLEMKDSSEFKTIEKFSDADLKAVSRKEADSSTYYYHRMRELREIAFRQAVGADAALDAVLKELE